MKNFIFDGRSTKEWNIGLSGSGIWGAPVRKGTSISIPGRSGAMWIDEGCFDNLEVMYPCWMASGFSRRIDDFRAYLMAHSDAYYRLEDDYHPNEFRLARYPGPFTATPGTINRSGRFDVIFDCDPRRFLKSGETEILLWDSTKTANVTIYNPTHFPAYPMIKIAKANVGSMYVNDVRIQLTDYFEELDVDGEIGVAYYDGGSIETSVIIPDKIPLLPGANTLRQTFSASEPCEVSIIPRWYTI